MLTIITPSDRPFHSNSSLHHILSSTCLHSTTDLARYSYDNGMIMDIRMFSTLTQQPFCRLIYLFIYLFELSHFKSGHPSCMLAAQAPVTACHSEFQMAPIFPLMARRSGRQHIGEGGPRHAAGSRGSIREKRGTRQGERRGLEHHASSDVFFRSFFMIILETAFSFGAVWHGWLFHLCYWLGCWWWSCPAPVSRSLSSLSQYMYMQCSTEKIVAMICS